MTEHAKITVYLHQCSSLTTTVSHIIAVFRVRQCFANKKLKKTVLHKTAVLHITVVWFQICLK